MGIGDEIVAAGQAQRLFEAAGRPVMILDDDGSPRWHDIWNGNPAIVRPGENDLAPFQQLRSGPGCRPYIVYPFTPDTGWTFKKSFRCRDHVARIYLTGAERRRGEDALGHYGPYVLIEPFTKHENFRWPIERWGQLIEACPDLTFVQHVHAASPAVHGAYREPATFREACGLAAASDAYIRSESGLCHAAAALGVPQVTLFGGCMDPEVMAGYPGQTVLADHGPKSPCGSWRLCAHCLTVMDRITVDDVVAALRATLQAGRVS